MKSHSLIWKITVPVVGVFALSVIAIYFYVPSVMKANAVKEATASAEQMVQQFKTLRGYYTRNVVQKVLGNSSLTASFDHSQNKNAIPLPATMIHDLSSEFSQEGMTLKLYSAFPFPNRADRRLDSFGQEAWTNLNKNPDKTYSMVESTSDGSSIVRVAVADKMVAQACVACHNSRPDTPKNDWKLGDVRGVLEVDINIDELIANGQALGTKVVVALIIILGVVLAVITGLYRVLIHRRVNRVAQALEGISGEGGDLSQRLDVEGSDEVSRIASAFNRFVEELNKTFGRIASLSGDVAESARSLSEITLETNRDIQQQQSQTETAATSINQITSTVDGVAENATQASEASSRADAASKEGQAVTRAAAAAISQVSESMQDAKEVVLRLAEDSKGIGAVLDVIRGIAEQTNLLALNAAIEAARAGEQGRGFAVVADEVRSLAQKTQASTEEIHQMIEKLNAGTQAMVSVIEQVSDKTVQSVEYSQKTSQAIEEVSNAIDIANEMSAQIAAAAREQHTVVEEINQNITSINDLAHRSSDKASQIAESAEGLSRLAGELDVLTARFGR
ncbi:chemotaxis protein [Hahella sp. CCB-MM4]|uniref:methyl-accepting chemotaxis protein n=1 Tax=Hahella sp. (strain CCB-MM4) TaxID=1926491 RepID=UPI000B9AB521|nr:methyl-accepting chemotaxis protein [Hahella sp. CCB-MM4]OZG74593.1 chemotaxis protein [Hahella sp. CCB-MM4]